MDGPKQLAYRSPGTALCPPAWVKLKTEIPFCRGVRLRSRSSGIPFDVPVPRPPSPHIRSWQRESRSKWAEVRASCHTWNGTPRCRGDLCVMGASPRHEMCVVPPSESVGNSFFFLRGISYQYWYGICHPGDVRHTSTRLSKLVCCHPQISPILLPMALQKVV